MRAAIYERYGAPDVLDVRDIAAPVPKDDEVLLKTFAATVTSADWRARSLIAPRGFGLASRLAFGLFGPRRKVLGTEMSGRVAAIGPAVRAFGIGDPVIAFRGLAMGCHADYVTVPAKGKILPKPENLSFVEAAALSFAGTTALYFLRTKGRIQAGETVLIVGASGALGTSAIQLAKHFGAQVTGVCGASNTGLVSSLGADRVINYATTDVAQSGETFDIVFDTVGALTTAQIARLLNDGGRGLLAAGSLLDNIKTPLLRPGGGRRLYAGVAAETKEDMRFVVDLAAEGKFSPVIDRIYALSQIREAHAYVGSGHKRGNVVIDFRRH